MLPTLSPRQKAGLACALALLLWAPMGVSHGDHTMLTGHSTFYNGVEFDPCLGSIAGIMRHRVMWFDDQVLVESYGGKGTFIYVTEAGAPDPRGRQLYSEGVFYDFVDPNGASWHVEESFMPKRIGVFLNSDPVNNQEDPLVETVEEKTYVWTVELSSRPIYDDFADDDPHTFYNFLTLVDTCKMKRNENTRDGIAYHNATGGEFSGGNGHPSGAKDHTHERWMVNLWVGKRPIVVPAGVSNGTAEYQTQWSGTTMANALPEDGPDGGSVPPELP